MKFINLTPHALTVEGLGNLPASGSIARVSVKCVDVGTRGGIRLRTSVKGEVENLPISIDGVTLIVSGMVLDAIKASGVVRQDVVAPDTGSDAIRENGQIVAVRGFVC